MMSSSVKVIADSISPANKRITTLECRYWRGIHAELMTHRAFARNAASSRAIPFYNLIGPDVNPKCTVGMLENDPFIPEFIGIEQKGMQSGAELEELRKHTAQMEIQGMLGLMLKACKRLHELGVHKSIINRYLEPWSYITVVITATEWDNFFKLRCHPAAEKHFQKLANQMRNAMAASKPVTVDYGGWHLPYLGYEEEHDIFKVAGELNTDPMIIRKKVSAARCARVSYLTHDGKRSITADLELAERLLNPGDGAIHASPFEHVAQATSPISAKPQRSGPFIGWYQYRKEIPGETFIQPEPEVKEYVVNTVQDGGRIYAAKSQADAEALARRDGYRIRE